MDVNDSRPPRRPSPSPIPSSAAFAIPQSTSRRSSSKAPRVQLTSGRSDSQHVPASGSPANDAGLQLPKIERNLSAGSGSEAESAGTDGTRPNLSNFPGMSGIALAPAQVPGSSSPPAIPYNQTAAGPGFHFSRLGRAALSLTSSSKNPLAPLRSGSRSRHRSSDGEARTPENNIRFDKLPYASPNQLPGSNNGVSMDSSSSTSAGGSSAWNFFRPSSSNSISRQYQSDSISSVHATGRLESSPSPELNLEGSTTPHILTGGTTTPLGMAAAPVDPRQKHDLETQIKQSTVSMSASFVITQAAASSTHGGLQDAHSRRKNRQAFTSSINETGIPSIERKADGLVAMADRDGNTIEDTKLVVAGRSCRNVYTLRKIGTDYVNGQIAVLKILSIRRQTEDDSAHSDEDSFQRTEKSAYGLYVGHPRRPQYRRVQVQEDADLQAGLHHISGKNSKAALINDVSWGYDCEIATSDHPDKSEALTIRD